MYFVDMYATQVAIVLDVLLAGYKFLIFLKMLTIVANLFL